MEIKEDDFIINAPGNYEDDTWYVMINSGEKYSFKGAHLKADEIKQQILDNQEIVQRLRESLKIINEKRNDKDTMIHIPFTEQELKSILENKIC